MNAVTRPHLVDATRYLSTAICYLSAIVRLFSPLWDSSHYCQWHWMVSPVIECISFQFLQHVHQTSLVVQMDFVFRIDTDVMDTSTASIELMKWTVVCNILHDIHDISFSKYSKVIIFSTESRLLWSRHKVSIKKLLLLISLQHVLQISFSVYMAHLYAFHYRRDAMATSNAVMAAMNKTVVCSLYSWLYL